jgi:hypothetical protein
MKEMPKIRRSKGRVTLALPFMFQDRSSGGEPKLSICERNLALMGVCRKSTIQLVLNHSAVSLGGK